jgi:putative spermidine/putrescine transport system substrate-binding protein
METRMRDLIRPSRRSLLVGSAALLAAPSIARAQSRTLLVSDPGGVYSTAFAEAYYRPFTQETGIGVTGVVRRSNPAAEFKAQVDTKNYAWDISGGITSDVADLLEKQNLLEPIDLSGDAMAAIPADMKNKFYMADNVVTFVLAYRTDKYPKGVGSFSDIWDTANFPGRRGMRKLARDMIEIAMRATGVPGGPEIYRALEAPGGWERAFAKLDEVKKHVQVWWDSSPQSTQLLQSGEVDICPTFNARAQTAEDAGAPVAINWNGGFYSLSGWAIPRGTPKGDIARQFVSFCARPDRQAAVTRLLPNGPSNPEAYKFIDKAIAAKLPTFPDNLRQTARIDDAFWGKNKTMSDRRFNEWLLQG